MYFLFKILQLIISVNYPWLVAQWQAGFFSILVLRSSAMLPHQQFLGQSKQS